MRFPEQYGSYLKEPLQVHSAELELELENDDGHVRVERRLTKNQLSVSRPLDISPGPESFYLINTAGGVVQGDRLSTHISLGKGCRAHVTTQSANKIYGMEHNCAVMQTSIELKEGAYLEYTPEPNIPYAGSRSFQLTNIKLHGNSRLFCWDIAYPGRYARNEEFGCDVYFSHMEMCIRNKPVLIDSVVIDPKRQDPWAAGIMGGKKFLANAYAYASDYKEFEKCLKGVSYCINGRGVMLIRIMGNDSLDMRKKLERIAGSFRKVFY
jgi:urease accessory protein